MTSLYLLQFACLIISAMLALLLAMGRLQTEEIHRSYERSRWALLGAMLLLAIHYALQMTLGIRAQSDAGGTIVNILFYTPTAYLVTYSILNIECNRRRRWRYVACGAAVYAIILALFGIGLTPKVCLLSPHLQWTLHALFLLAMAGSVGAALVEIHRNHGKVEADTGADIGLYLRFTWSGYIMLCCTALLLVFAIVYRPLLFIIGPVMMLSLFFFVFNFVAMGYNLTPIEDVLSGEIGNDDPSSAPNDENVSSAAPKVLTKKRIDYIAATLEKWCEEKNFRDSNVNMASLSHQIGVSRRELSQYFEQEIHDTFRVWLSNVRFCEAQRLILSHPDYSNESISAACGFSSRSQLYHIFSNRTGMTPREWSEKSLQDS